MKVPWPLKALWFGLVGVATLFALVFALSFCLLIGEEDFDGEGNSD